VSNTFTVKTTPGEFESAGLVLRAWQTVEPVNISVADLNGPSDSIIPAAAVDVYVVKEWYKRGPNFPDDLYR